MQHFILNYLNTYFEEQEPMSFYRDIFPKGELQIKGEQAEGKYHAIAVELLPKEEDKINARRFLLTDSLEQLPSLLESNNFIIISPVSYCGRSRDSINARYIYALAIDFDGITEEHYLIDFFHQIEINYIPKPTKIVFSGSGLHLYYILQEPLPCFKYITKQLAELKKALTKKIWNSYTTSLHNKVQIESLFQGFRLVGGVTKFDTRTKAFITGDKVTIEYLNSFVGENAKVKEYQYKSKLSLTEAKEKFPVWYKERIIDNKPRGGWTCKKDLYKWWYNKLYNEAQEGHRYYTVMVLSVMAKKSGVSFEELEKDAYNLIEHLDRLTITEQNHFTRQDIMAALEMYNENYIRFPIDTIVKLTNIPIEKNKRNYRPQEVHLKIARATKKALKEVGLMKKEGRPSKAPIVQEWRKNNPNGKQVQCVKETGLNKGTVSKYWRN